MSIPPIDIPCCFHCGYDRSSLDTGATSCPECGHPLSDTSILAMTRPPRWWRIHRFAWRLFEYSSYAMLAAAACLIVGFFIMFSSVMGGSVAGTGSVVVISLNISYAFAALGFILTFLGGLCAIARVPWNDDREWRRGMLLATISIAVPLIALFPMAMLAAGAFFLREALSLAIILSPALILVDVRILKARAASFVRFTTNDTQSVFYNDSHRSVDITAAIALIGALYMLLGGARSSIVVFAYALMILGWLGMRGKAAVAVRKQISRAADHGPAEGDEPTSPRIA